MHRATESFTELRNTVESYLHDLERSVSKHTEKPDKQINSCINFRDCGSLAHVLKKNRVYRSSQLIGSKDVQGLGIRSVLDLRVLKKSCKREELAQAREEQEGRAKRLKAAVPKFPGKTLLPDHDILHPVCHICSTCSRDFGKRHGVDPAPPVYHADLVPAKTKLVIFKRLPALIQFKALGGLFKGTHPEKIVAPAVIDDRYMGPAKLYCLILDQSKSSIAKALRVFVDPDNYPVLVHCIHGKDRTGLIVMLLLLVCDAPQESIVLDFVQSELQLKASREDGDMADFDDHMKTDNVMESRAESMIEALQHLRTAYGGGRDYCRAIGLSDAEIASIRINLMVEPGASDVLERVAEGNSKLTPRSGMLQRMSCGTTSVIGDGSSSPRKDSEDGSLRVGPSLESIRATREREKLRDTGDKPEQSDQHMQLKAAIATLKEKEVEGS